MRFPHYFRALVYQNEIWLIAGEYLDEMQARQHAEKWSSAGFKTNVERVER